MRRHSLSLALIAVVGTFWAVSGQTTAARQDSGTEPTLPVAKIPIVASRTEKALAILLRKMHPLVDAYFQVHSPHEGLGSVPVDDEYLMARLELPGMALLVNTGSAFSRSRRVPDGFVELLSPDLNAFDTSRYEFTFVKGEFLGETKAFVYDVRPLTDPSAFSGRVWIDDRDFAIVRYAGSNRHVDAVLSGLFRRKLKVHIDGWRANIRPSVWVPTLVSVEETTGLDSRSSRILGQIRLWNYENAGAQEQQELTGIRIAEQAVVGDDAPARQPTPVESERYSQEDAVRRLLERLRKAGIVAPPGDVERVCTQVATNLVAGDDLPFPSVECAILLPTSPLSVIPLGERTLLINRTLLDVLPDEASIAMALAHPLSHLALGDSVSVKALLADTRGDVDLLEQLRAGYKPRQEADVDLKVVEILDHSIYRDKLLPGGLFLDMIGATGTRLPVLIGPQFREHADSTQALRTSALMRKRLGDCDSPDTVCALPIGSRLLVDPLSDRLELLRARITDTSGREKRSLAVTAFFPRLEYLVTPVTTASAR